MTNDLCRSTCAGQKFAFAGTEAGAFCFCGNDATLGGARCDAPCTGYAGEICGGSLASSVSLTGMPRPIGSKFLAPMNMMPSPPPNGWQCVINASGSVSGSMSTVSYRYFEIQTAIVGAPTMSGGTKHYPVAWSVAGGGLKEYSSVSATGQTQATVTSWYVDMSNPGQPGLAVVPALSYKSTTIASGHLQFQEESLPGEGTRHEWSDTYSNGVFQPREGYSVALTPEAPINLNVAPPVGSTLKGTSQQPYSGPQQPGGVTGTTTCSWNITL